MHISHTWNPTRECTLFTLMCRPAISCCVCVNRLHLDRQDHPGASSLVLSRPSESFPQSRRSSSSRHLQRRNNTIAKKIMSAQGDTTLPATRRMRKSIGGRSPSRKTADRENATVDISSSSAASRKKSRSKSIGPGGLDALKSGTGNRRVVRHGIYRMRSCGQCC